MLTSCYTYIDYSYKTICVVDVYDTVRLDPIHYHDDSLNHCIWVDEFVSPFKTVYVFGHFEYVERRTIKKIKL